MSPLEDKNQVTARKRSMTERVNIEMFKKDKV